MTCSSFLRASFCIAIDHELTLAAVFPPSVVDLCQDRERKIADFETNLQHVLGIADEADRRRQAARDAECVKQSAAAFYWGDDGTPARPRWPFECNQEAVLKSMTKKKCVPEEPTEEKVCLETNAWQRFVSTLGGVSQCRTEVVEPVCTSVADEDVQHEYVTFMDDSNAAKTELDRRLTDMPTASQTSKSWISDSVSSTFHKVNLASSLYIGYLTMLMLCTRPLVVHKRKTSSRMLEHGLKMNRASFVLFTVCLFFLVDALSSRSFYASIRSGILELIKDPCAVDPEFHRLSMEAVHEACTDLIEQRQQFLASLSDLRGAYDRMLVCGMCKVEGARSHHPATEAVKSLLDRHLANTQALPNCFSPEFVRTLLADRTSTGESALKSLLKSGSLAQLWAKANIAGLVTHGIGFVEPLAEHGGVVEKWGAEPLSEEDQLAIRNYARDRHIAPMAGHLCLAFVGFVMIAYGLFSQDTLIAPILNSRKAGINTNGVESLNTKNLLNICPQDIMVGG